MLLLPPEVDFSFNSISQSVLFLLHNSNVMIHFLFINKQHIMLFPTFPLSLFTDSNSHPLANFPLSHDNYQPGTGQCGTLRGKYCLPCTAYMSLQTPLTWVSVIER